MKQTAVIFSVLLFLLLPSKLLSQTSDNGHLGVGISFDPSRIGHVNIYYSGPNPRPPDLIINYSPILFYFVLDTNNIRIEPMFGLSTGNSENTQTSKSINNSDYSTSTNTSNYSDVTVGLGAFYLSPLSNNFNLYFGPRIYLNIISAISGYKTLGFYSGQYSSYENKTETKELDITAGLSIGAEYFPFKKFSFGGEASINYTRYGNPDMTITPSQSNYTYINTSERTQYSFFTSGIFFVRWYFL